jgi:hypothetical protein
MYLCLFFIDQYEYLSVNRTIKWFFEVLADSLHDGPTIIFSTACDGLIPSLQGTHMYIRSFTNTST